MKNVGTVLEEEDVNYLPHGPKTLSSIVLFSLRIGDIIDLNAWLPQAKLRPHAVLKLLCALVDNKYNFGRNAGDPASLKERFKTLLNERYPETEPEKPECERDGTIPEEVAKAMRRAVKPCPGEKESGLKQKHATPLTTSEEVSVVLNEVRPSANFEDRTTCEMVARDVREILALRKHYVLEVTTGKELLGQWNSKYFSTAFPFSIPRAVSGPDFPPKRSDRRIDTFLEPLEFARMIATRVEASVRNDWLAVPAARNFGTKWKALCGDDAACRHIVDMDKPGVELAAELSKAANMLYEKLVKGYYWDGRKKRKINHDITKLPYAYDLSTEEKRLVKDLTFLSSTCAGTQEIRMMIGHNLFGARVEYGEPLFLTISPSSRHSGLTVLASRYRRTDPAMVYDKTSVPAWAGQFLPRLWQDASGEHMDIDVPDYGLRRIMAARDPAAVIANFSFSVRHILARLSGLRMCPDCPKCNNPRSTNACSNHFGHNMLPMGGFCGLAVALGGCVEYQQNDNPHFHGNLHLANVYQFKTLPEIAELIQQNLVSLKDLTHFQDWICHEDPLDLDAHKASLPQREEQWMEHNSAKACDTLCCFPSYLRQESPVSMWSKSGPCDVESALSEGATWRDTYFADAEMVFSIATITGTLRVRRRASVSPFVIADRRAAAARAKLVFPPKNA